jgi:type IV secretion system protein VirB4
VGAAIARILRDPAGAVGELKVQFTNDSMKTLLRTHIERDLRRLDQSVQAFARQLADFMQIEILNQQGQFTFFRRLLNYDDWRVTGRPQSTQFLDYQVVNSDIEAERDHLRVGDHIIRVLTMKEAITETRPLVLDALLKIPANFYVVTEWTPLPADKARKEVNKRRRHFNMSKTGFVSQMGNDATTTNPRDVLVDESKQADIENLGDCLRALGDGQSLGDFSLTIVLYGQSRTELDQLVAEFTGVFTNADGNLFAETYNQLNAYFATVPGNYSDTLSSPLQPGESKELSIPIDEQLVSILRLVGSDGLRNGYQNTDKIWFFGTACYSDGNGIKRNLSVCRRYDNKTECFTPDNNSDREYSD